MFRVRHRQTKLSRIPHAAPGVGALHGLLLQLLQQNGVWSNPRVPDLRGSGNDSERRCVRSLLEPAVPGERQSHQRDQQRWGVHAGANKGADLVAHCVSFGGANKSAVQFANPRPVLVAAADATAHVEPDDFSNALAHVHPDDAADGSADELADAPANALAHVEPDDFSDASANARADDGGCGLPKQPNSLARPDQPLWHSAGLGSARGQVRDQRQPTEVLLEQDGGGPAGVPYDLLEVQAGLHRLREAVVPVRGLLQMPPRNHLLRGEFPRRRRVQTHQNI